MKNPIIQVAKSVDRAVQGTVDSVRRAIETRFGFGNSDARMELLPQRSSSGRRSDEAALMAAQTVPIFRSVLEPIAQKFATNGWRAVDSDGEEIDENPFRFLIESPCPELPGQIYHDYQMRVRDAVGESFAAIFPSGEDSDQPFELWPLPPPWVHWDEGVWRVRVGRTELEIPPEEMFHVKSNPDLTDPYQNAQGLGHVVADELETIDLLSEFQKSRYRNFMQPDMIVRLPSASDKQLRRFKAKWRQRFSGVSRAGLPLLSGDESEIDIQELQTRIEENITEEERDQLRDIVRQAIGVGPQMIGELVDANKASSIVVRQIFAKNTLKPRLSLWESVANDRLRDDIPGAENAFLRHVDPVPDDKKYQLDVMTQSPPASFTRNEWRQAADHPPDPERGDVYVIQSGTGGVREIPFGEEPEPQDDGGGESGEQAENVIPFDLKFLSSEKSDDDKTEAERIAEALDPETFESETAPEYERFVRNFAQTEATEELGVDLDFEILNPFIRDFVEEYGAKDVKQITETTRDHISEVVESGFDSGKNPRDIAESIKGVFVEGNEELLPDDFPFVTVDQRMETIGRTEMLRASNSGKFSAHKASKIVKKRQWLFTPDTRVREEHNGFSQIVGVDEEFEMDTDRGVFTAQFPGDFGVGFLDINCRCTTAPKVPERLAPVDVKARWKRFDARLRRAEKQFAAVWKDVMRQTWRDQIRPVAMEVLGVEAAV